MVRIGKKAPAAPAKDRGKKRERSEEKCTSLRLSCYRGIRMRDCDRGIREKASGSRWQCNGHTHTYTYMYSTWVGMARSRDLGRREQGKMFQGEDIMGKKLSPSKGITSLLSFVPGPSCSSCVIIPFSGISFAPGPSLLSFNLLRLLQRFPSSPLSPLARATDIPLFGHRSAIIRDCTHSSTLDDHEQPKYESPRENARLTQQPS